jgi:hypothetical protein
MKIREIRHDIAGWDIKHRLNEELTESIDKHLSAISSALLKRDADDTSLLSVNINQLADLITVLRVLSNTDYRDAITADDVGLNPRNASELYALLDQVPDSRSGKLQSHQAAIVSAIVKLAPSVRAKELAKLKLLQSEDQAEREAAVKYVQQLAEKAAAAFKKVSQKAASSYRRAA